MSSHLLPSDFPALYELSTKTAHSLRQVDSFIVGRHLKADLILLDVTCSRQQFRIVRQGGRLLVEPLSPNVETRCNGRVVDKPLPLEHGMLIEAGSSRFRFLEHQDTAVQPEGAAKAAAPERPKVPAKERPVQPSAADMRTQVGPSVSDLDTVAPLKPIALSGQMLIGRDAQRVQIPLPHARVS
ncbi:MAG: FHA domain-containing protein, partial [Planctomycetota bacterium]